jgi:pSer/pThr/pTyr-binding forkhead associated (FHA) protein
VTVNGQRIRHARVADGDVIELGVKRFRFTSSDTRIFSSGLEGDRAVDETTE